MRKPRIQDLTPLILVLALAPRAAAPPFFFIQLTDPQFGMAASDADFAQETANFEFAVATVNRLRPAFVVVTGDLVNKADDEAQVAEYRRIAAKLDRAIPLYNLPGNHDLADPPTPEAVAAYVKRFGPDRFTFRHGPLTGIVINTPIIVVPQKAPQLAAEQERWLRSELERARREGARHIVVFQHHPWFLADAAEPDQYFNVGRELRARYLGLFREFGVSYVFAGHYHRNAVAKDGDMEMVTTGPVGKPLGDGKSGIRIVTVTDAGIQHRYYDFAEVPNKVTIQIRPDGPEAVAPGREVTSRPRPVSSASQVRGPATRPSQRCGR